jgi:15-cis-phytoene desaturase
MRCVVLGAGVSGLVAALELARRKCRVTVVEAAPFAGGRTSSWRTASGVHADTGLHVVASHYVNLLEVLTSAGAVEHLTWWNEHLYLRRGARPMRMRLSRLPAPFHLLRPARAIPVTVGTRARLARAALEIARYRQDELQRFDNQTYLEWHRARGLGDGFLLELAQFAADATTFLELDAVSARPVLSWLKYMFRNQHSARIGTWRMPIAEGLVAPLVSALKAAGGSLQLGTVAVGLAAADGRVRGVEVRRSEASKPSCSEDGHVSSAGPSEELVCDAVVSALPVQSLRQVLGPELAARARLERALELRTVPAMSVLLTLDRPLRPRVEGVALVAGDCIRNVVDLHSLWGCDGDGDGALLQCLVGRASERAVQPDAEIVEAALEDLRAVWPAFRSAVPIEARVDRIPAAMVAALPGSHAKRPVTETGIANLFVAGDWSRHDLNASIEGAVVSGRLAAGAVLRDEARNAVRILPLSEPRARRMASAWTHEIHGATGT